MARQSILLKNGTVLQHDKNDNINILYNTDILIVGNKINSIGKLLHAPPGIEIIDCTDKIISPGFIDSHRHLWQTQMKGRFEDQMLFEYIYTGMWQSYSFQPEDIFWGQLGGCLESIDAGTTTVVDHAHLTYSPEYASKAIAASASSGLRSFYCYVPTFRLKSWTTEIVPDPNFLPEWLFEQLEQLAQSQPFGDGRVYLGFGFDLFFLPKETVINLFEKARSLGIKLLTSHYCKNTIFGTHSVVKILDNYGLLKSDMIIAHASEASDEDVEIMTRAKSYCSVTPETEGQMALGLPNAFRKDMPLVSLGVDCHTTGPSDIISQMRLALQLARQSVNQKILDQSKYPATNVGSSTAAFNLGTIEGARSVGMESQIGSLTEGKLADVVIFETRSPTMMCAAQKDPIAAIVRHASIRDIDTVIIDGIVRKKTGKLLPIKIEGDAPKGIQGEVEWSAVAKNLSASWARVDQNINKLDMEVGRKKAIEIFGIDETTFV